MWHQACHHRENSLLSSFHCLWHHQSLQENWLVTNQGASWKTAEFERPRPASAEKGCVGEPSPASGRDYQRDQHHRRREFASTHRPKIPGQGKFFQLRSPQEATSEEKNVEARREWCKERLIES